MVRQKNFTEAGDPSDSFPLRGDDPVLGPGRALISIKQTTGETFVTLRRCGADGETVIQDDVRVSSSRVIEVVASGKYDMIVAEGDFHGNVLATVEQHQ